MPLIHWTVESKTIICRWIIYIHTNSFHCVDLYWCVLCFSVLSSKDHINLKKKTTIKKMTNLYSILEWLLCFKFPSSLKEHYCALMLTKERLKQNSSWRCCGMNSIVRHYWKQWNYYIPVNKSVTGSPRPQGSGYWGH